MPLELLEAGGEDVRAAADEVGVEVGVAELLVLQELPHDQERPALADDVERVGDRAVLVVAPHAAPDCTPAIFRNGSTNLYFESKCCSIATFVRTDNDRKGFAMVTSDRMKWFALALLCVTQFVVVLDIAIVNVALPSIQADLGFSQDDLQWVISAYALVFGGFLLLGGRLADIIGRRVVFMVGLVIFSVGSLLCGLAWNDTSLIVARALQGLGAATITPAALSILTTTFTEGRERNIALGAWGAVGGFGAAAGVLAGGILTDLLSWEWIFFVNVPVGIAALALSPILLRESQDAHGQSHDIPGAVLVTGVSSCSSSGSRRAGSGSGSRRRRSASSSASAVMLVAFALWEQRQRDPLVPFSIFRLQTLTAANVAGFIMGTAHVLDVPDAHAVHAAGARVLADQDGSRPTSRSPARRSSGRTSPRSP